MYISKDEYLIALYKFSGRILFVIYQINADEFVIVALKKMLLFGVVRYVNKCAKLCIIGIYLDFIAIILTVRG
jgi:hypothetical protein